MKNIIIFLILVSIIPFSMSMTYDIIPIEDTFINVEFNNYQSFGSETYLNIQYYYSYSTDYSFQGFNLSNITKNITNVEMNVYVYYQNNPEIWRFWEIYFCNSIFDEMTLTGTNQSTIVQNCTMIYQQGLTGAVLETLYTINLTNLPEYINNDVDKIFTLKSIYNTTDDGSIYFGWESKEGAHPNNISITTFDFIPIINITYPLNDTISQSQNPIEFYVYSDGLDTNCSLLLDGVSVAYNGSVSEDTLSIFSPFWSIGSHEYKILCTNGDTTGSSGSYTYTFNSTHSIVLFYPPDGLKTYIQEYIEYEVYDSDNGTTSCMLFLNNTADVYNLTVLNDTVSYFYPAWINGNNTWYIQCYDGLVDAFSDNRTLTFDNITPAITLNYPTENQSYDIGVFGYYINTTLSETAICNITDIKGNFTEYIIGLDHNWHFDNAIGMGIHDVNISCYDGINIGILDFWFSINETITPPQTGTNVTVNIDFKMELLVAILIYLAFLVFSLWIDNPAVLVLTSIMGIFMGLWFIKYDFSDFFSVIFILFNGGLLFFVSFKK